MGKRCPMKQVYKDQKELQKLNTTMPFSLCLC